MNEKSATSEVLQGVPTLALLPARPFGFKVSKDKYMYKVPNKGKFSELDTEFFAEDDSEFEIVSEDNVNISVVAKLLFATKQYPDLEPHQMFCPINFKLEGPDLLIYGQIVTVAGVDDE